MARVERDFDVFADFHQFLVRDRDANWDDLPDRWTEDALNAMFVQGGGYIAVATARDMPVPVSIRVLSEEPPPNSVAWDLVVSGRLPLPSGVMVISGDTDNGASGGTVKVDPGVYDLRIMYADLESVSADGLFGGDRYVIEFWPSRAS